MYCVSSIGFISCAMLRSSLIWEIIMELMKIVDESSWTMQPGSYAVWFHSWPPIRGSPQWRKSGNRTRVSCKYGGYNLTWSISRINWMTLHDQLWWISTSTAGFTTIGWLIRGIWVSLQKWNSTPPINQPRGRALHPGSTLYVASWRHSVRLLLAVNRHHDFLRLLLLTLGS